MQNSISRRRALSLIAAASYVASRSSAAQPAQSLGAIAAQHDYLFGASAGSEIEKNSAYRALYAAQAKVITTDVALKMGAIAPQPGPFRFESADRLLAFCSQHRIAMRGHCLIWNDYVPAWIKSMSSAERRAFFDRYIDEVVGRYAGKLQSWDIVNEPFWPGHKAPGFYRLGPWYDAFGGPAYIRRAFERAAAADKGTKFTLNEAQTERDDEVGLANRQGLLRLVAELKDAGVKLDVVGLQGHLQPQYPHDPARFTEFLRALAGNGVDIYITEFDVRDDTFPLDIEQRDAKVAGTAERFLSSTLRNPAVKAVITWQLADNYSFYTAAALKKDPGATRRPRPLPYDERLRPKPLWHAIARAFENAKHA